MRFGLWLLEDGRLSPEVMIRMYESGTSSLENASTSSPATPRKVCFVLALVKPIAVLTPLLHPVYSVVLDPTRNIACSGSMDGTVRVWDLNTGTERFMLTGHTSLVGLLGLSASHLVSAAADSTLRIWDPDTGEMKHTLAAHNGAITCFQHDEFKVLSGSDGTLKMWDIRDGSVVRDLLTGIIGAWQVVFEGRWCVAASNQQDATVLDVWDFGTEEVEIEDGTRELREVSDWVGEPPNGFYEDTTDDEYEEEAVIMDVMDRSRTQR
jgi:F-box and WD-40 domain protein CDC4